MKKTFNYRRIYESLKEEIASGRYRPGDRLPTESQLQEIHGVSRITVKKAMEMLCEEGCVERFPGKGSFVLNTGTQVAKQNFTGKPKTIGLVMSGFSAYYGQEFIKGVAEECNRQGCNLMVGLGYNTMEEERKLIDTQIAGGAQGIIAMPVHDGSIINTGIVERAISGFPLVLVDRYMEGIPIPYIGSDNTDAAYQATRYLLSLGHINIGLVSPIPSTTAITEREAGYMKAYAMTNHQVHTTYLISDIQSGMPGMNTAENFQKDLDRMKAYYRANPDVTAFLCIDHNVMHVCKTAALQMGLRVPEDISLICFDTVKGGHGTSICTHICQPEREMGQRAVRMLFGVIAGDTETKHILLPAQLQVGDTTAPPACLREKVKG